MVVLLVLLKNQPERDLPFKNDRPYKKLSFPFSNWDLKGQRAHQARLPGCNPDLRVKTQRNPNQLLGLGHLMVLSELAAP